MLTFFKKPIVIIATVIILGGGITGGYFYSKSGGQSKYDTFKVKKTDLVQEVSVTGHVQAAESVDLAFETIGKVARVYIKIGDNVRIGQVLASLLNGDLAAQLLQAQANMEAEQAKLNEMNKGSRAEEIVKAETTFADKKLDLLNARAKAEADLNSVYGAALTAAQSGATDGKNALLKLTEIQFSHFLNNDSNGAAIADAKEDAVELLLGYASVAGRMNSEQLSLLNGGAFSSVQAAISDSSAENIEKAVSETVAALRKIKFALDIIPVEDDFTATQKTDLSAEKASISAELTAVSSKEQAIAVQKATNASSISAAESIVNTAENDLILKKVSSTPEQIAAQEARIKSARANVQIIQAQLAKTVIISPINGTVTKQELKAGEIASSNIVMISVMSEAKFEISANIPEVDIAKIKLNDFAKITLDAYGEYIVFEARVIEIEPAETIVEGVSTYKITLQFMSEDDRIRSGMTANIDILTAQKNDVLTAPQRAVISRNGQGKFVKILKDNGDTEEVKVEIGIRGLSGEIEIISGLNEGDIVITFERE